MARLLKKSSKTRGLPPGSIIHIGDKRTEKVKTTVIDYSITSHKEIKCKEIQDCFTYKNKRSVSWINIDGIHDIKIIEKIGKQYDIHPLVLEDIVNADQRPKTEEYEKYLFLVLKMLNYDEKKNQIIVEQVSFILGNNYVISFQEKKGDVFDSVRERIRNNKGRIRKMGTDYLLYALIDAVVDNYFIILEKISDRIEDFEEKLILNPDPEIMQLIYGIKREMIYLRKSVWPLRDVINILLRNDSNLIHKKTIIYLRDLYDHTIQVIDTVETFRDMVSGMLDMYMSSVSNKMNEVMKVLTIFAAIFIPLTFIAGIYGMNFNPDASPFNMPELGWFWGYPFALIIMLGVGITMLIFFKRKKYL